MPFRRALWILIVASAALRLFSACFLGLGNDEAYHWLYAEHPALGYYDHPPMMAWIEMLGLSLPGAGASTWALRIGFIAMFAASTWLLANLTARFYGERAGFLAALALNLTGYYGLAASTFALPDGPLLFFWLLSLDRMSMLAAISTPTRRARLLRRQPPSLAPGRSGLGRCDAQQVPRHLPADGHRALPDLAPPRAPLADSPRPLYRDGCRASRLQPGDHLERDARLGFVSLSGWPRRRKRSDLPP